jgi:RimJ/RimL family protein N-acetyltransferase
VPDYFLTTERLGFRCWREDDLALALQLWGDARVSATLGGPFTPVQIHARLHGEVAQFRDTGLQLWPVFLLHDSSFAGCAGLRPWRAAERIHELGYHLIPSCWSKGLATEAAAAIIQYAFTQLDASALFAGHHPSNHASRHVLLKLGFHYTGDAFYEPAGWIEPQYLLHRP